MGAAGDRNEGRTHGFQLGSLPDNASVLYPWLLQQESFDHVQNPVRDGPARAGCWWLLVAAPVRLWLHRHSLLMLPQRWQQPVWAGEE